MTKIYFSESYQKFPAGFVPWIELIDCMHNYFLCFEANVCFSHLILYQSRYIYGKLIYALSEGLVKMVFLKALDMPNTKIIRLSTEAIAMIVWRERMPATGTYDTVKSTPSSMDYPSAHVLE